MFERIMIIGCCGSGKSTLSKSIQEITGLPLIHLDKEYYKPNWEKPLKDEWDKKILELCQKEKWIMDGNYISSMHIRMNYADTLIWLDMNRTKCLYRAILRAIMPSKRHRSDMGLGCNERHDIEFYQFIWNFNKITKPRIIQLLEQHKDIKVIILKNSRDIRNFINTFGLI